MHDPADTIAPTSSVHRAEQDSRSPGGSEDERDAVLGTITSLRKVAVSERLQACVAGLPNAAEYELPVRLSGIHIAYVLRKTSSNVTV